MIMLAKINTGLKLGLVCYSLICFFIMIIGAHLSMKIKLHVKKNDESKSHVFDKEACR